MAKEAIIMPIMTRNQEKTILICHVVNMLKLSMERPVEFAGLDVYLLFSFLKIHDCTLLSK